MPKCPATPEQCRKRQLATWRRTKNGKPNEMFMMCFDCLRWIPDEAYYTERRVIRPQPWMR